MFMRYRPWHRDHDSESGRLRWSARPEAALWLGRGAVLLLRLTVAALLVAPVAALAAFMLRWLPR